MELKFEPAKELRFEAVHTYIPVEDTRQERLYTTVYEALDEEFGRSVFIKEVRVRDSIEREQAMWEIKAMTKAEEVTCFTPRIYETFFDTQKKILYIVMQFIKGKSLREYMKKTLPMKMLDWMIALCDILSALEKQNLSSKDIKPENIMITSDNVLYLVDFGLSISTPARDVGTKHYRAPEMDTWRNLRETSRNKVDMFSIGVILYEFFCGECPRAGYEYDLARRGDAKEWKTFIAPKEKNPNISDSVNDIIVKCMKLIPKDRYKDAATLKYALMKAKRQSSRIA